MLGRVTWGLGFLPCDFVIHGLILRGTTHTIITAL